MNDDLISRAAAIEAISKGVRDDAFLIVALIKSKINKVPSAQPEHKRGEWEIYEISPFDGEGCRCHECRFEGVPYWNFCPNCGADMRGEQDG